MEKSKYAFMLMGPGYNPELHNSHFETETRHTYIVTVRNFEEACLTVEKLVAMGVGALELCGAFNCELTQKLIDITEGEIAIGYVTHFPSEDEKFKNFFGK